MDFEKESSGDYPVEAGPEEAPLKRLAKLNDQIQGIENRITNNAEGIKAIQNQAEKEPEMQRWFGTLEQSAQEAIDRLERQKRALLVEKAEVEKLLESTK